MGLFDELLDTKRMEDPEAREAQDLRRGKKKWGKQVRTRETSVSASTYLFTMRLVGVLLGLIVLGAAAWLVYEGVMLFIPES